MERDLKRSKSCNRKDRIMKEQKYIIKNIKSFAPKQIFECGQCFRWNKEEDNSYTGIVKNNVINVKKIGEEIIVKSIGEDNIEKLCIQYFDLDTNYEKIKDKLSNVDKYLEESVKFGSGIRILNQDTWETLISFIISANNNIPRIKGIIEKISEKYGNEIPYKDKKYYTFPTPEQLGKASVKELRNMGLGFRDERVFETTQMVLKNEIDLEKIKNEKNINSAKEQLLKFPGVGPKVADCIMLFSMQKKQVFPIDVWIRRVMNNLYINKNDENKVKNEEILKIVNEKYKEFAGIAQQYLFYWIRETKLNNA